MRYLIACALLLCGYAGAEDWSWLDEAKDDPALMVQRIRTFEELHQGLAEAGIASYRTARNAGEEEKAAALRDEIGAQIAWVKEAYEKAVALQPENAALINYQGEYLYDVVGDEAEGLKCWQRALELDDDLALAHNNLGIHFFHSGQYEEGLKHLDRALKLDGDQPDFLFNMVQMYLTHTPQIMEIRGWDEKKIYREAMKMSKKAARLQPDDYELTKDYAMNFFSAERFGRELDHKDAAKAWEAARACAPSEAETFATWLNEGRVWLSGGNDEKAVTCLEEALKLDPNSRAAANLLEGARKRLQED